MARVLGAATAAYSMAVVGLPDRKARVTVVAFAAGWAALCATAAVLA